MNSADVLPRGAGNAARASSSNFHTPPHEFGHMIGAPDEYNAGHPNLGDTTSMIDIGRAIRGRYMAKLIVELDGMFPETRFFVSAEKTFADAPPLPTQKLAKVFSIKQTACVIVDSYRQRTDAYLARKGIIFGRPICTLTRTSEFSQISDDGKAFVVVESGSCLTGELPSSKTRFVAFYVNCELSATILAACLNCRP